jgi:hypothetical protein
MVEPKYPKWIVIYNIHTPGSDWLGKSVEFFDDAVPARARSHETSGSCRPFYPPYDRQYLAATQGYKPAVSWEDYIKECNDAT